MNSKEHAEILRHLTNKLEYYKFTSYLSYVINLCEQKISITDKIGLFSGDITPTLEESLLPNIVQEFNFVIKKLREGVFNINWFYNEDEKIILDKLSKSNSSEVSEKALEIIALCDSFSNNKYPLTTILSTLTRDNTMLEMLFDNNICIDNKYYEYEKPMLKILASRHSASASKLLEKIVDYKIEANIPKEYFDNVCVTLSNMDENIINGSRDINIRIIGKIFEYIDIIKYNDVIFCNLVKVGTKATNLLLDLIKTIYIDYTNIYMFLNLYKNNYNSYTTSLADSLILNACTSDDITYTVINELINIDNQASSELLASLVKDDILDDERLSNLMLNLIYIDKENCVLTLNNIIYTKRFEKLNYEYKKDILDALFTSNNIAYIHMFNNLRNDLGDEFNSYFEEKIKELEFDINYLEKIEVLQN